MDVDETSGSKDQITTLNDSRTIKVFLGSPVEEDDPLKNEKVPPVSVLTPYHVIESSTFGNVLDPDASTQDLYINKVFPPAEVSKVFDFIKECHLHGKKNPESHARPDIPQKAKEFLTKDLFPKGKLEGDSFKTLLGYCAVGKFMGFKQVFQCVAQIITDRIRTKTPEEIQSMFGLPPIWTEEMEKDIFKKLPFLHVSATPSVNDSSLTNGSSLYEEVD